MEAPAPLQLLRDQGAIVATTLAAGIQQVQCLLDHPPDPGAPARTVPLFAWNLAASIAGTAVGDFIPDRQHPPDPGKGYSAYQRALNKAREDAARHALDRATDTVVTAGRFQAIMGSLSPDALAAARLFLNLAAEETGSIGGVYARPGNPPGAVCATEGPPPNVLINGVPQTGISGAAFSVYYWKFSVPFGATHLEVEMSGGTGDADLYVRFGALPSTTQYNCRPYLTESIEECHFAAPPGGDVYIMIRGYTSYSGVTLQAHYN